MAKKKFVPVYSHKAIRKTIKRNELRDLLNNGFAYFRNNTENVLIAGIIAVVIIILVPLYFKSRADNEQRANNLLNRAMGYERQPVDKKLVDPSNEAFRSAEEKYKKTQEAYAEVSNNYRNNWAADQAKIGQANALYFMKEYQKALDLFQEELARQKEPMMQASLQERIGVCHESLKQWQEALQTYQVLLQTYPNYFNRRAVHLGLARCLWRLNKKGESLKIMKEEEGRDPGTYWTEFARQQREYLETESK